MGYINNLSAIKDNVDNLTLPSKASLVAQGEAIQAKIAEYTAETDVPTRAALDAEIRSLTSTLAYDTRTYALAVKAAVLSMQSLRSEHQEIRGKLIACNHQKQKLANDVLPLIAAEVAGMNTEVCDYFRDGMQSLLQDQYAWEDD